MMIPTLQQIFNSNNFCEININFVFGDSGINKNDFFREKSILTSEGGTDFI